MTGTNIGNAFVLNAPKPVEGKTGVFTGGRAVPWADKTAAFAGVIASNRSEIGQLIAIGNIVTGWKYYEFERADTYPTGGEDGAGWNIIEAMPNKSDVAIFQTLVGATQDLDTIPFAYQQITSDEDYIVTGSADGESKGILALDITGDVNVTVNGESVPTAPDDITFIQSWKLPAGASKSYHIKSDYVEAVVGGNSASVASAVAFTGTETQGQLLTGTYTYSDTETDPEGTSLLKWYRSDDNAGTNRAAISGATGSTYTLQSGDVGKFIQFAVTPKATTGTLTGTEVFSAYSGAIAASSSGSSYGGVTGAIFHINGKAANVTQSGGSISAVSNLAGSGAVTAVAPYKPQWLAASGTTNPDVIEFDVSSVQAMKLDCPGLTFTATQDLTVVMVMATATGAGSAQVLAELGATGLEADGFGLFINYPSSLDVAATFTGDVGVSAGHASPTLGRFELAVFNMHKSKSTNEAFVELNGGGSGPIDSGTNNNTNTFVNQVLTIGARSTGAIQSHYSLAEMLIYPRILTPTEKTNILAQAVTDYGAYTTAF